MLAALIFLFAHVYAAKEELVGALTQQHKNRFIRFCNNEGSMEIVSDMPREKRHQVRTIEVLEQNDDFVTCWATSTKLGVRKRDRYLVKLSVDRLPLRRLADKLALLVNVPNVQRCRWDCVVGVAEMTVPVRRVIDRRRRKKRTIWGRWNFFALPLEPVPGERVGEYLRKISQDIPPYPASSRQSLMEDEAIKTVYRQIFDTAKTFWKAGWVHTDMTVGNVVRHNSETITFIEMDNANRRHNKMNRRDILDWMVAIATDFVFLGYSFALMIVCPEDARGQYGVYEHRRDCITHEETWTFITQQDGNLRQMLNFKRAPSHEQNLAMLPIEFADLARKFYADDNPEEPHFDAPPTYQSVMAGYFSDLGPSVSEMLGPSIARETNRALSPPPENAPSTDSLDNVPISYGNIAPGDEDMELPSFLPKSWGKQRMRPMGRGRGIPIQIEIDPASGAGSSQAHSELGSGGSASVSQSVFESNAALNSASTHVHLDLAGSEIPPLEDPENRSVDTPSEDIQSGSSGTVGELADNFENMDYPMEYRSQEVSLSATNDSKNGFFIIFCSFASLLGIFTICYQKNSIQTRRAYADLFLQDDEF